MNSKIRTLILLLFFTFVDVSKLFADILLFYILVFWLSCYLTVSYIQTRFKKQDKLKKKNEVWPYKVMQDEDHKNKVVEELVKERRPKSVRNVFFMENYRKAPLEKTGNQQ